MTSHLVSVSIGPVQDFIAQARRSRDLWFGSHLLSEIARAAARRIADTGGQLIFPAVEFGDPELEPCDGMMRQHGDSSPPLAVSNKLLFQAADAEAAKRCILAARDGAQSRWRTLAEDARRRADRLVEWPQLKAVWNEQVDGILEFYAAAAPVTHDSFGPARDLLEQQLVARKNLREFQQFEHHRPGAPKSSFDGARVSVLRAPKQSERARRKFRIPQAENLDAVGVVKRTGGRPEQLVPIANVALAPWLHVARAQPRIERLVAELESAMQGGRYRDLFGRVERADTRAGAAFRSDAQVLLDGRLEALLMESDEFESLRGLQADATYQDLKSRIQEILRAVKSAPHPYVAALVADGDRMGPAPADAIYLQGSTAPDRLVAKPADVEIWDACDDPRTGALQLLTLDEATSDAGIKPERGPAWWTEAEFVDWLCGLPNAGPSARLAIGRQPHGRTDVHVKMSNDTETAEQGFLWANEFREALTIGHPYRRAAKGLAKCRRMTDKVGSKVWRHFK